MLGANYLIFELVELGLFSPPSNLPLNWIVFFYDFFFFFLQTLMVHMQSTCESKKSKVGSIGKKSYVRPPTVGDQKQANYSIEIWKKAFKDACERLCPVRAAGHECGCLPMLARLVSVQILLLFHHTTYG